MLPSAHRNLLSDAFSSILASRSKASERVRVTVHELGHAVVAHRLGSRVLHVLLGRAEILREHGREASESCLGLCANERFAEFGLGGETLRRLLSAEERACVSSAGLAAEALARGNHPMRSWLARDGVERYEHTSLGVVNDHARATLALEGRESAASAWRLDRDRRASGSATVRAEHIAAAARALSILSERRNQEAILELMPTLMERGRLDGRDLREALGDHRRLKP